MRKVTEEEAVELLESLGAVLTGHFIGTQGKHLSAYVSKEVITRYPHHLRTLAKGLAMLASHYGVDVVVAPPMGALSLGTMVAEELQVEYAYLEPVNPSDRESKLTVKRLPFQEAVEGRRVGIVEDIIVSGKTSGRSIRGVRANGGKVAWLGCIWNRSESTARSLKVARLIALVNRRLDELTRSECEKHGLCYHRVPINRKPGHGWEHELLDPGYPGGYV